MTGDAACRGIRDHDPDGSIGLVGEEPDPPYSRPPLSKALWQGKDESSIWRGTAELGVDLHLGRRAVSLDRAARQVDRRPGRDATATSGSCSRPAAARGGCRASTGDGHRLLPHAPRLPAAARPRRRRRLVRRARRRLHRLRGRGGAHAAGCEVTMVFPEAGIGARLFPRRPRPSPSTSSTAATASRCSRASSSRRSSATSGGFRSTSRAGGRSRPTRSSRGSASCPRPSSPRRAGLEVSDGIVVDEYGRAGDTRRRLRRRRRRALPVSRCSARDIRVEHEDQANSHGRAVGANMAGADEPYSAPAVLLLRPVRARLRGRGRGRLAAATTLAEWVEPLRKGVVAYVGRGGPAAGVPPRRHVGEGRRGDGADRRREPLAQSSSRPARLRRNPPAPAGVVPASTTIGRDRDGTTSKRPAPSAAAAAAGGLALGALGAAKPTVKSADNLRSARSWSAPPA